MKLGHHQNQNFWFSKGNVKEMKDKQEIGRKYMQPIYFLITQQQNDKWVHLKMGKGLERTFLQAYANGHQVDEKMHNIFCH